MTVGAFVVAAAVAVAVADAVSSSVRLRGGRPGRCRGKTMRTQRGHQGLRTKRAFQYTEVYTKIKVATYFGKEVPGKDKKYYAGEVEWHAHAGGNCK